ncbi:calcium/calmodulin-dependent protein kinase type II alpha chain-like X2 [Biomphalaria pfeifferi]|uniref:Calcium/calmodulin-dependent protein kinase type II alpha chain-like X2 n=1 Tax=Biomphalaria pfeifferi TaxID=112525 RepID=A0AAD8BBV7_BIOPF|nr:calcium/calmodulin-dependent protein kinase type II alpha chain-like X2 [Biomphalaria pfeifferi]
MSGFAVTTWFHSECIDHSNETWTPRRYEMMTNVHSNETNTKNIREDDCNVHSNETWTPRRYERMTVLCTAVR